MAVQTVGSGRAGGESGGRQERVDILEGIGHPGGEVTLEVGDDAVHAAGEQAKAATDATDEKWVEAVKAGENLFRGFAASVGLFTKEDGVDVLAVEEDHPVAGQFGMKDGNEIDRGCSSWGLALRPDADGMETLGQVEVALTLGNKVVHVLKGGDKFSLPNIRGQVLDRMADGQHGFVIEEMGHIRDGKNDDFGALGAVLRRGGHGAWLFGLEVGLDAGAEEPL